MTVQSTNSLAIVAPFAVSVQKPEIECLLPVHFVLSSASAGHIYDVRFLRAQVAGHYGANGAALGGHFTGDLDWGNNNLCWSLASKSPQPVSTGYRRNRCTLKYHSQDT
jgi:hypothetical protein